MRFPTIALLLLLGAALAAQTPTAPLKVYTLANFPTSYHLATCPVVKDQPVAEVTAEQILRASLSACKICHPELADTEVGKQLGALQAERDAEDAVTARAEAAAAAKAATARLTRVQAQAAANEAASLAKNDPDLFDVLFREIVRETAPGYRGIVLIENTPSILIIAAGPVGRVGLAARERVRKFQPPTAVPWTLPVVITVAPQAIDAPDIERVVVQRNGEMIPPIASTLALRPLTTRMGVTRLIRQGDVTYPASAFAPGAAVVVTAIPKDGSNIVKSLDRAELLGLQ